MEWTIRLEGKTGWGETRSVDLMTIKRPALDLSPEEVGLTLDEGKAILRQLQQEMVAAQASEYAECRRICPNCLKFRRVKDTRTRQLQTLFGSVVVKSPRFFFCACETWIAADFSPIRDILPDRCTPELTYLQAKLAALMPYRKVVDTMAELLPIDGKLNHETIRRRTHRVGKRLAQQGNEVGLEDAPEKPPEPATSLTISIDGGFVRARPGFQRRNFEVIAGRCSASPEPGKIFAAVRTAKASPLVQIREAARVAGIGPDTAVTVLSDGADGLRRLVEAALEWPTTHILDWFHIAMRVQNLIQIVKGLPRRFPGERDAAASILDGIQRLKWRIWHRKTAEAERALDHIEAEVEAFRDEIPERRSDVYLRISSSLYEFKRYILEPSDSIVNYGARFRRGERISTGYVESTVNQLVSKRMIKKQQMRWTPDGAERLLQVRRAVLNGDLDQRFRSWHQRFRPRQTEGKAA